MTNPANVKEITSRLISYLRTVSNEFIKADLVAKLTQLAERYPFYSLLISLSHDIIIIDVSLHTDSVELSQLIFVDKMYMYIIDTCMPICTYH